MWRVKTALQRFCAAVPMGNHLYRLFQSTVGGLRGQHPGAYVEANQGLVGALGGPEALLDVNSVEVGTGWNVSLPLALHLSGASRCTTFDASRYCRPRNAMRAARALIPALWEASSPELRNLIEYRWAQLEGLRWTEFLEAAGISYRAPADAGKTSLEPDSQDLVFSRAVLQHIPPKTLERIFQEAARVLKPKGLMWHWLDMTDQRRRADRGLSRIEYLRYSHSEWDKRAGNRYAYSNRWRVSQFARLAEDAGFSVEIQNPRVDAESVDFAQSGALHADFANWDPNDLATVNAELVARKP